MGKEHLEEHHQAARVRSCIASNLRSSCLAIPQSKQWLVEVCAEALQADLAHPDADMEHSSPAGAAAQARSAPPVLCGSDLPASAAEAEATWGSLITDTLDLEEVEAEDVRQACGQLLDALGALAAQLEDESGWYAAGEDGEEEEMEAGACEMCRRTMPLTKHHLIPRDVHAAWKKRGASFEQLQAGAMVCRTCHNAVHRLADNKTLGARFSTVELIMEVPAIQRHVAWAQKQKVVVRPQRAPGSAAVKRRGGGRG